MAKIYIRGHLTPQTVSVQIAKKVDEIKKDGSLDDKYYISVDGFSCEKGDIKSVVIYDADDDKATRGDNSKLENNEKVSMYLKEFNDEIKRYANSSLEEKMQFNLKVAKMYCYSMTGGEIEPYKEKLKSIFFEELKKEKLVVNPTKYLRLFEVVEPEAQDGLVNMNYIVRKSPLTLMNKYLSEVYAVLSKE